ncbi:MAG: Transcriptional regulator, TetR family [Blastococcus sp.]|nr:Transcriptional regulator, TetR family [Blastococcus sp.]
MARASLVTQSYISRRAAHRSVTPRCTIGGVTSALSLAAADDFLAAADAGVPVRRSRAERQAIVLDTAERLFAGRSSRSVGMDELVRETGLGKMTVYRLFKSKDDLVGAYLSRKAATVLAFIDAELVRLQGDPRAALLSVVDAVERDVTRTGFRGCPFTNVSSEYDDPQHPARSAAADYKFELHMRLERLADEIIPGGGDDLAAQIHLIIDGMYLSGGLLGPDGPASHGRQLAERLIGMAITRS